MTRSLITGANGFTGRYLASVLAARGHEVHGIVHRAGPENRNVAQNHICDLLDRNGLAKIISDVAPDHVIHLAAIAFIAHGDVNEMYQTNILGTRNLFDVLATGPVLRSMIIASSANVYGNRYSGLIKEDTCPEPANDYGVTKIATEYQAKIYSSSIPIIIARPFNYTGRGQSKNYIVPKVIDHAKHRTPKIELGNIDVERDFSDVRAVVDIYARLLETPEAIGQTFNVSSGVATSLRRILETISRLAEHEMEIAINPEFVRANEVKSLYGSRARLESVIGPVNMPPLEETLRWMLDA